MIIGSTSMMDSNPYQPAKPGSLTDSLVENEERREFANSEVAKQLRIAEIDPEIAYGMDAKPIGIGEMSYTDGDAADSLQLDGNWYEASKIVHDYKNKIGAYSDRPADARDNLMFLMTGAADRSGPSNKDRKLAEGRDANEVAEFGIEYAGHLNHNFFGGLVNWSEIDEMPPEVALAQAALLEMYERTPDLSWPGTVRFIKNMLSDPANALGVGSFKLVQELLSAGGKAGIKSGVRKKLMQVALGSSIVGAEGSAYAGMADYLQQRFKFQPPQADELRGMEYPGEERTFQPNWESVGQSAAVGYAVGSGLGVAIGQGGKVVRAARDAFNEAVYGPVQGGAVLRSGVGPIGTRPEAQLAQQPDEMGFRSGLINMLDALPESASGEQMLATLSDPQRLAEFGAKAEEIGLTGLDKFLRDAEGAITKADIADFLEANRVRLDEARDLGSGGYTPGEYDTVTEAYDLDDLISSRETDEYEFSRGSVSGYRNVDGGFVGEPDYVDIMINKYFDIFDAEKNKSVLDEVELSIENNFAYFGNEEAEAAREAAKEIIQQIRNELRGSVGNLPSPIKNRISELYEDLSANLYGDEVFEAMENRASYDVIDNYDTIGKFDSEDEAIHRANNYIENIDGGDGTGQYSSITFPTESGPPENYKEVRLLMPEDDKRFPQTNVHQHFEQNTFAHYRSTDREVVLDQPDQPDMFGGGGDPKSVMFIEEIQSDLMQAGGRRGYQTEEVMDTWKAEGTEINERMKDKLRAFGYGEVRITDPNEQARDVDILTNLSGLYEGFSRMMKGKDRVEAMKKYLSKKLGVELSLKVFPDSAESQAINAIVQTIAELPKKKMSDEQLYDAFNMFVATLSSFRGGGNEVGGSVRDLSPKRYGSKMVDSDGYDRGLEFLEKLTSKDLRDFYRSRDKAIIAQGGVPDIPLKKDWVELTMKRAIYDALEEGKTMIAFPNHAETVGAIEYGGRPATGAIARLYEKEVPKILQKLAKQTGGEIKTGSIAESIKHREYDRFMQGKDTIDDWDYPNQGSVIVLDLSKDPQKVKREGFAVPAIAGGATALTAAQQMQQQEQPQQ
mgnify:CR=1 FL=1